MNKFQDEENVATLVPPGETDVVAMIKRIEQQLTFLERKIDTLIRTSQERPFKGNQFSKHREHRGHFDRSHRSGQRRNRFNSERGGFKQERGGFKQERGGFNQERGGFKQERQGGFKQERQGGFKKERFFERPWKKKSGNFGGKKKKRFSHQDRF